MTYKSLHEHILNSVHNDLNNLFGEELSKSKALSFLFKNYRFSHGQHQGLRLTFNGNAVLCKHFAFNTYPVTQEISNKAIIVLDKKMLWPYYISIRYVTFYSDDDAAWYQLNGKNINEFAEYL